MTFTPTHISFTNTFLEFMADVLVEKLTVNSDPDIAVQNEATAGLIRAGKLQDDPTVAGINILLHPAKADSPNMTNHPGASWGINFEESYELGGDIPPAWFLKKFNVELRLFFDNETERSIAQTKAQVVLSRVVHAIHGINGRFHEIPMDTFGEKGHMLSIQNFFLREGGGIGTFIWRGTVEVDVLTSLNYQLVPPIAVPIPPGGP